MRELSIVIPTYNESDNVAPLLEKLTAALSGVDWEVIFVDDNSPDKTWQRVADLAATDARVKILRRVGRKGLSTACIEGAMMASAPVIAVMDADMQHDERVLPAMFKKITDENCEIVVGTRYAAGGSVGEWNAARTLMSKTATKLGAVLLGKNTVSDPMSGFFMLRSALFAETVERLSGEGFKILLDLLTSARRPLAIGEVAYTFRLREHGESKLSLGVLCDFGLLLADKTVGKYVPARFLLFVAVGLLGVGVHLGCLAALYSTGFVFAQSAATLAAMVVNFFLNNAFTYADRSLKNLRRGLALFILICGLGALPNIVLAGYLYEVSHLYWLLAGALGMLVSAVWNYAVSQHFIWRRRN
ncbi:MAG: glycosyltransferase family 2 protein [Planctomycetota bacterium]|jgi:dolichol-phosphate mannosyltransferase|nr:glycosyltransferase family 2 protein [Planctomycetota bacterium]